MNSILNKAVSCFLAIAMFLSMAILAYPATIQATSVNNSTIVAGDIVYYGTYPQSALGKVGAVTAPLGTQGVDWSMSANINDSNASYYYAILPIAWRVLENNNGELFMITEKNIVGGIPFNDVYTGSTWETSSVRTFLNATSFLNQAFTTAEQAAIKSTQVINDGNTTTDKVFLLSVAETQNTTYFADVNAKKSTNTDYAAHKIAPNGYGVVDFWWLRSANFSNTAACGIYNGTGLLEQGLGVSFWGGALRPAIKLDSAIASPLQLRSTVAIDNTYTFNDSSVKWTFELDAASTFFRIKNNDSGLYLTRNNNLVNGVGKVIEMPMGNPNAQEWNIFWVGYYCIWGLGGGGESLTFYNGQLTYETHLWDNSARNVAQAWMHPGGAGIIDGTAYNMKTYGYPDVYLATGKNTYTKAVINNPVAIDSTYMVNEASYLWTFEIDAGSSYYTIKNNESGLYLTRGAEVVNGAGTMLEMNKNGLDSQLWNVFPMSGSIFIWGTAGDGRDALTVDNGKVTWQQAVWDGITMNQRFNDFGQTIIDGSIMKIETSGSHAIIATGKNTYPKTISAIIKTSNDYSRNQKWKFEKVDLENKVYYRIKNSEANEKNKYLTAYDNKVILAVLDQTNDNQLWTFEKRMDVLPYWGKTVNIKNKSTGDKLLVVTGNTDGSAATMTDTVTNYETAFFCLNESWDYNETDLFEIRRFNTYMNLQGDDADDLEPVTETIKYATFKSTDEKSKNQKWIFEKSGADDYYRIKNSVNNLYLTVKRNKVSLRNLELVDADSQIWFVQKNKTMEQWDIFTVNIMTKASAKSDEKLLLTGSNLVDARVSVSTRSTEDGFTLFYLDGKSDFNDGGKYALTFYTSTVALSTEEQEEFIGEGAEVYYVSETGNDLNDGLSETNPIKTFDKLLSMNLKANNTVKIKSGSTFSESLILDNLKGLPEKHIKFTSYGEGTNPVILVQEAVSPLTLNYCEYISFDRIDFISKSVRPAAAVENSCGIIFKECNLTAPINAPGCITANNLRMISNERGSKNISIVKCNISGGIEGIKTADSNLIYISKTTITKSSSSGISFNNVNNSVMYNSSVKVIGFDKNNETKSGLSIKNSDNITIDTVNISNIISGANGDGHGAIIQGSPAVSNSVNIYNSTIKSVDGAGIYFADSKAMTAKSNIVIEQSIIDDYARKRGMTGFGLYFENGLGQKHTICNISDSFIIANEYMLPFLGYPLNGNKNLLLQNVKYSYKDVPPSDNGNSSSDDSTSKDPDIVTPVIATPTPTPTNENTNSDPDSEVVPEDKPIKKISILFRVLDSNNRPVSNKIFLLENSKAQANTNGSGYVMFENIKIGDEVITIKNNEKILATYPIQILIGKEIAINGNKIFIRESDKSISVDLVLSGNMIKITKCTSGINILNVQNQWVIIIIILGAAAILTGSIIAIIYFKKKKNIKKKKIEQTAE